MPIVDLLAAAVGARSRVSSAQALVNLFPEIDSDGRITLYGTPGKRLYVTLGTGPIRGGIVISGRLYVVSGTGVYTLTNSTNAALIGTLSTSAGSVYFASNGVDILLVDGNSGYTVTSSAITEITDPDFPAGVTWADYIDGFYIVGGDGSQKFYKSASLSGSTWSGLDFASAEGDPDLLLRGIVCSREILLFGSRTLEFWSDTGAEGFPFERTGNAFVEHGVVAPNSVVKLDSRVFWLGRSADGEGIVYRLDGYSPVRTSTHAEEAAIAQWSDMSDATAWAYVYEGHSFYCLSSESGDMTLVYDVASDKWHRRAWRDTSNVLHRDRIATHFFLDGVHLGGDHSTGSLYVVDMSAYTDNGDAIVREIITSHVGEGEPVVFDEVELYMEAGVGLTTGQGSNPQAMLATSRDYGATFPVERWRPFGRLGRYETRVRWFNNGHGLQKTFKIRITDPVKVAIRGIRLRYSA